MTASLPFPILQAGVPQALPFDVTAASPAASLFPALLDEVAANVDALPGFQGTAKPSPEIETETQTPEKQQDEGPMPRNFRWAVPVVFPTPAEAQPCEPVIAEEPTAMPDQHAGEAVQGANQAPAQRPALNMKPNSLPDFPLHFVAESAGTEEPEMPFIRHEQETAADQLAQTAESVRESENVPTLPGGPEPTPAADRAVDRVFDPLADSSKPGEAPLPVPSHAHAEPVRLPSPHTSPALARPGRKMCGQKPHETAPGNVSPQVPALPLTAALSTANLTVLRAQETPACAHPPETSSISSSVPEGLPSAPARRAVVSEPAARDTAAPQVAFVARLIPVKPAGENAVPASMPPAIPAEPEQKAAPENSSTPKAIPPKPDAKLPAAGPEVKQVTAAESASLETPSDERHVRGPETAARPVPARPEPKPDESGGSRQSGPDPAPPEAGMRFAAQVTPSAEPRSAAPEPAAEPTPPQAAERPHAIGQDASPRTPAAHDIHIELNGGERRVEVRLVERGGEVKLAVRTPDTRLAGELRDSLPALSSRLEQAGFRTEAWRPEAAGSAEWRRDAHPSASAGSDSSSGQSWQDARERQHDSHPQKQKNNERQPRSNGKEFAWLMSSLR